MTPEQIEVAARKLCELRRVDPDAIVGVRTQPLGSGMYHTTSRWRNAAEEITEHLEIQEAIKYALEQK